MGSFINAITLGLTGLMTLPIIPSLFPSSEDATTAIMIGPGDFNESFSKANQVGGPVPNVALFNVNGERIGFKTGRGHGDFKPGRKGYIYVDPIDYGNNQSPEYLSVSASGSDALCIAWIAVTGPNEERWFWSGVFGRTCGQLWYPSKMAILGSAVRPPCIWISDDGRFPMGFGLHMTAFADSQTSVAESRSAQYEADPDLLCNSKPRQHFYPSLNELQCIPVFENPPEVDSDGTDKDKSQVVVDGVIRCSPGPGEKLSLAEIRRMRKYANIGSLGDMPTYGVRRRSGAQSNCDHDALVVSNFDSHSAKEVCESMTSYGPDFISTKEGYFCDLCTHTLWPLCTQSSDTECFDTENRKLKTEALTIRDEWGADVSTRKVYRSVDVWE